MKKCLIFTPQDSSIYAAHTSMRYHSTCVPQLRVCSPVGFNRVTKSFVSRETPGPYPPPFRIDRYRNMLDLFTLVLNLLPTNNGFLPSASGLEMEAVLFPLWAEKQKAASAPTQLHLQIAICQKGAKPAHPQKGPTCDHGLVAQVTVLLKLPRRQQRRGQEP